MKVEALIHGRPRVGEAVSGDAGVVHRAGPVTWVMLIDALGHGPKAAHASALALEIVDTLDAQISVVAALHRIHKHMAGSRGGAATLLRFAEREISFVGVGNVELRTLTGPPLPFVSASGVLGGRMPRPRPNALELREPGSALLFTDGVSRRAPLSAMSRLSPQLLCEALIRDHAVDRDDATVIHLSYAPPD